MATFLCTVKFTPKGIEGIRDTVKRAEAFKVAAKKVGVELRETYWTLGPTDGLLVFDAPDEETITALMLHAGSLGFVQTQTARAFNPEEMQKVLAKMPK